MDVVLVGLPGSGKSAVGRRLAARHNAAFVDTDAEVEREAGMTIAEIFDRDGEAAFRDRDRAVVAGLGSGDPGSPRVDRVIATGGGTVIDPRNRWRLYRGRRVVWLDVRPEAATQRLRRSPFVRPLVRGADPLGTVRDLAAQRTRFYAAGTKVNAMMELGAVVEAAEAAARAGSGASGGTVLLRAETKLGQLVFGEGIAAAEVAGALERLGARRAVLVSEPVAWAAVGEAIGAALRERGVDLETVQLPSGEAAKTLSAIEAGARVLARLRVERSEPIVAIGGGAVTDAAGFLAATYLRGIPVIHVPTTLAGQVDAAIGGKTAVDLPEGKNLVGAFHQPAAIVIDIALLATLPKRHRRAALGESVKAAVLGEEPLFATLEADGSPVATGDPAAFDSGALAEIVERTAWAKIEVVLEDERETASRISLNLGHSLGHAFEAAAGYSGLLHGEAVSYGLRAACRIGTARHVTPPERAARTERLLDRLGLAVERLDLDLDAVMAALDVDKKHRDGHLQWVLPTADGYAIDAEVPHELVHSVATEVMAGRAATIALPAAAR
jgi:shikimate kinase / 3-dehydroquinate synthase